MWHDPWSNGDLCFQLKQKCVISRSLIERITPKPQGLRVVNFRTHTPRYWSLEWYPPGVAYDIS